MFFPEIPPGMKKGHHSFSQGINSRKVWPFMEIAAVASQGEIVRMVGAAVLFGHDVLYVMDQFAVLLVQAALFATLAGAPSDGFPCSRIHGLLDRRFQMKPGFEFEDGNEIGGVDQRLVLRAVTIAERAFVCLFGELVNPLLYRRGYLEIFHSARGFSIQTAAQGFEETVQATRSTHASRLAWNAPRDARRDQPDEGAPKPGGMEETVVSTTQANTSFHLPAPPHALARYFIISW